MQNWRQGVGYRRRWGSVEEDSSYRLHIVIIAVDCIMGKYLDALSYM